VVDDQRSIVKLVQVCLERAGYQVVAAFAGEEALREVESEKPDLIVLDAIMPHMDGPQVLQRLQTEPARHIPVIMLTATSRHAHVSCARASGAPSYLSKPFSPPELLTAVKRILSGADEYGQRLKPHSL
jgi:two-component system alkaline phosphatase synthesis response regulator PhoP